MDLKRVEKTFGEALSSTLKNNAQAISTDLLYLGENSIALTDKGKLLADRIILDLIFDDETKN
jgi:hypothetical protein